MQLVLAAALFGLAMAADCEDYGDCVSCTSATSWSGTSCRWCPPIACHSWGSPLNTCSDTQQITAPGNCPAPTTPPGFEVINEMMKGVYFPVDNQEFTTPENIKISINNLVCGDVALLSLHISSAPVVNGNIGVNVSMPGLTVRCTARWAYTMNNFPYFSGDGGVIALATASGRTIIEFASSDFNKLPPSNSSITDCTASVSVVDSTWQGGISATIAETFKSTVNGKIGSEVQSIACKSIASLGASFLQQAVTAVSMRMAPYTDKPVYTPLQGESNLAWVSEATLDYQSNPRFQQLQGFAAKFFNGEGSPATLPINDWIRDLLPGGHYVQPLDIEITNGTDSMLHTAFTVKSISISGVDSMTVFQPLSVLAPHTLESKLAWRQIDLNLGFEFDLAPGTAAGEFNASRTRTEHVQVHTSFKDLGLHVAWLLAVGQRAWMSLPLGGLLAAPAPCLLSTIPLVKPTPSLPAEIRGYIANVTMLNVSLGDIGEASLAGFVSEDLATLFTELTNVGLALYERAALSSMPSFAETTGRSKLNDMIQEYLAKPGNAECPPPEVSEVVNFTENKLFTKVEGWVHEYLKPDVANKELIEPFTTTQSGSPGMYALREMFLSTHIGNAFISLDRVFITGLNSVDNITLLHPVSPRVLHSEVDMGGIRPLGAEVVLYLQVNEPKILDHTRMGIVIKNVTFKGDLAGRLNQSALNAMPLGQMFEWACWLGVLEDTELQNLGVSFGSVGFVADCESPYSCSSPGIKQLATNLQNPQAAARLGQLATSFMALLVGRLRPRLDASLENAEELCQQALSSASTFMTAFADVAQTPPVDEEAASQARFLEGFAIVSSIVGFLAAAACGVSIFRQYRRFKARDSELLLSSKPLVLHPRVPLLVRVLVPLLLAVNVAFMVSGHMSLGASVDIEMKLLGEDITVKEFYGFSLSGSLKDMYNAGAWGLLILVAGFSGVWPYAKIILMYWCWLAPPAILDEKARGKRLWFLDTAGKWSLIDMYVLIQSMVAFHISVAQPSPTEPPILPADFLYVNLHVAPVWGLYSFLFAVTLSLLLSHVCLYYHRKAFSEHGAREFTLSPSLNGDGFSLNFAKESVSTRMLAAEEAHVVKESLSGWVFQVCWDSGVQSVRLRPSGKALGGVLLVAGLCLQIGASFIYSFQFDVQGLAGLAIGWTQDPVTKVSLVNMAYYLCAQGATDTITIVGLVFISTLYLLASFIMPVLSLMVLSVLWWLPLTVKGLKRCLYCLEIICAWCALEVFLVSIIVALGEVGQISGFLVGDNCRSIDPFIKNTLIPLQFLPSGQATCFEVKATLLPGMYLLLLTGLCSNILHYLVHGLAEHALVDREFGYQQDRTPVVGCRKALQRALLCCWSPFLVVYKNQDDEEQDKRQAKVSLQTLDAPELSSVRLPGSLGSKKLQHPSLTMSSSTNSFTDTSNPPSLRSEIKSSNRPRRHGSKNVEKYPTSRGKKDEPEKEIR